MKKYKPEIRFTIMKKNKILKPTPRWSKKDDDIFEEYKKIKK